MLAKEPILNMILVDLYYVGRASCMGAVTNIGGGIFDPSYFQCILKLCHKVQIDVKEDA